ncbi:pseudouridine synthase [Clostridium tertium]|jgi:23S rRNA pseudouridine2605 synthase|uniref:pseudouridine synthase n=1 Tax=Clostridium TaxID=1485 RepID=UPI00115A6B37|nr:MULTISPECIES: pseudouridine synthase [Clostridium]MBS5307023.1 rRNA pseudouridine synthase [Clostridium sp.]MDB1922053.1 pseudouridine synthase [Clostridium tertium]MDB1927731.1 pseudouridine synthase [Clostridium tertium]MDB1929735.1 pseudouridine synthase [Clostridium tertium]MDB1944928.1 pseudouridine synthase [Clostridium tertium]
MEERLQKYMARCGVASRRKCEEIILSNKVKINDNIVNELGVKIDPSKDKVFYNGKRILPEENKLYIMLNKPEGYITSVKDEKGRKTILDLVKVNERIYPIGRLDYDSSGLILLTNDGDIYNKIIHPRVEVEKKYIALCKGVFSDEEIKKFENGIDIGGYITANAKIKLIDKEKDKKTNAVNSLVEIIIHEGKNRQIRKMCSALGHEVITLKRVAVGDIKLGYLKRGEWRNLTEDELNYINSL